MSEQKQKLYNLLSYWGLRDARMRAFEKDLPVATLYFGVCISLFVASLKGVLSHFQLN